MQLYENDDLPTRVPLSLQSLPTNVWWRVVAVLLLIVATNVTFAGTPAPVFELRLNGDATDSSGNALNGTLSGSPTYTADRRNTNLKAINLNGTDQFVSIPDNDILDFNGGVVSISVWFKITNLTNNNSMRIISKKTNFTDANGYEVAYNPVSNLLELNVGGGSGVGQITATIDLDGNWHHFAGVINAGTLTMYVDGVQVGATGTGKNALAPNTNALRVGCQTDSSDDFFGAVDDVRLYDVALSGADVTAIFGQAPLGVSVWDGGAGAGNTNWSTAANWLGDVVPAAGDDLVFDTTPAGVIANNDRLPGLPYDRIYMSSGFTLTGNSIALTDELRVFTSGTATVGLDIATPAGSPLAVTLEAPFTMNGRFTGTGSVTIATTNGPFRVELNNVLSNVTGGISVANADLLLPVDSSPAGATPPTTGPVGTGTLTLNNVTLLTNGATRELGNGVTFAGNFTIGNGTNNDKLKVNGTGTLGATAGTNNRTMTINTGSSVQLNSQAGSITTTQGALVAGGGGTGNLFKEGAGNLILSGTASINQWTINGGKIIVQDGRGKIMGAASPEITIKASCSLELDNTVAPTAVTGGANGRLDDGDTIRLDGTDARLFMKGNAATFSETFLLLQVNSGNTLLEVNNASTTANVVTTLNGSNGTSAALTFANGATLRFNRDDGLNVLGNARFTLTGFGANQLVPACTMTDENQPATYSTTLPAGAFNTPTFASLVPGGNAGVTGILYNSASSGPWGTTTTWTPNGVPGVNDTVIINANHVIDINGASRPILQVRFNGLGGEITDSNATVADLLQLGHSVFIANGNNGGKVSSGLQLTAAAATTFRTIHHGDAASTLEFAGVISQSISGHALAKEGTGRILFSNVNTHSGGYTNSAGVVVVKASNAFGTGTTNINGGVLESESTGTPGTFTLAGALNMGGGLTANIAAGAALNFTSSTAVNLRGTMTINGSDNFDITGLNMQDGDRTIVVNLPTTNRVRISGVVTNGANNRKLTKQGIGELELANANTHSANPSTQLDAGILTVGNATSFGANRILITGGELRSTVSALSITRQVDISGTCTFGGGNDFTLTGGLTVTTGPRTLQIQKGRTITVSGAINTTQALVVNGVDGTPASINPGILLLSGANTFTLGSLGIGVDAKVQVQSSLTDKLGDSTGLTLNGGTIEYAASSATDVTEVVGPVIVNANVSPFLVESLGVGRVTLNAQSLTRNGVAKMNLTRKGTSGGNIARLTTSGFADAAPLAFVAVDTNDGTTTVSSTTGEYDTAIDGAVEEGIINPAPPVIYETQAAADWNTGTTWVGNVVPPTNAYVRIKHNVSLDSFETVSTVQFQPGGAVTDNGGALIIGDGVLPGTILLDTNATAYVLGASVSLQGSECVVDGAGSLSIDGQIVGSALLTKLNTGSLELTNDQNGTTFSGGVRIGAGDFLVQRSLVMGTGASRITLSGGAFKPSATFSTSRVFVADGGTISVTGTTVLSLTGAMLNTAGAFTKDGTGTLYMSTASTRTGTTTVTDGVLAVQGLGAGSPLGTGLATIGHATNNPVIEIRTTGAGTEVCSTPLSLTNKAIVRGTGNSGTASGFTGNVSLIDGCTATFVAPVATDVLRLAGVISGGGATANVKFNGGANAGRISFQATNTFTGAVSADSGTFNFNAAAGVGVTANVFTVNATANVFPNGAVTLANPIILNGGTLSSNNDAGAFSGLITVQSASVLSTDSPVATQANLTIAGEITGSAALTVRGTSAAKSVFFTNATAPVAPAYSGTITYQGPSFMEVRATTIFAAAATLTLDTGTPTLVLKGDTTQTFPFTVNVAAAGTINVNQLTVAGTNNTISLGSLTLPGPVLTVTGANGYALSVAGATTLTGDATLNPTTASLVFSNPVGQSGGARALTKTGTGTLALGATNTYTGATNLNAGTTSLTGTTGSGLTTVAVGATLTGNGTVSGALAVNGILAPGIAADSTTPFTVVGAVVFATGASFNADVVDATAGNFDQLIATTGSVTLGNATLNINLGGTIASPVTLIDKQGAGAIPDIFLGFSEGSAIVAGGRLLAITYAGGTGNDLTLTDVGVSSNTISLLPTTLTTVEGGTAQVFVIRLNAVPTAPVTIPISSTNTAEGTVPAQVVITPTGSANVVPAGTVLVTPVNDTLVDGNVVYTVTTGDPSSADGVFNALVATDVADVTVTNNDNEVILSTTTVTAIEGGADATFTVRLAAAPTAPVNVTVTLSDPTQLSLVTAVPLLFNAGNFSTPQNVTISATNDALVEGPKSYTATVSIVAGSAAEYLTSTSRTVTVNATDNDPGILLSTTTLTTTEGGAGQIFTVALSTIPAGAVTVGLVGTPAQGTLSTATLNFAADASALVPQTVTVTSVNNTLDEGDVAYAITLTASGAAGYNPATATVNVTDIDNDSSGVAITPTTLITVEGGAAVTFNVVLAAQPTSGVTINLTNGNTAEGTLSTASVVFTTGNWNVPQTVTLTPVNDGVADGPKTYQITFASVSADGSYSGIVVSPISVTNADNPPPVIGSGIIVNPAAPTAGFPVKFTLDVTDPQGQPVTVSWNYGDGSPADVSGMHVFAVSTPVTVTATYSDGLTANTISVTLNIASASSPDGDADGDGLANNVDPDDDGDGFPDELEVAAGTSSLSPLDRPTAAPEQDMFVTKLSIKLSFKKAGGDSIQLTARLPINAGQATSEISTILDVGGVVRTFALTKGSGKSGADSIKFSIKQSQGVTPSQVSTFTAKFSKGNFQAALASLGLTNADVAGVGVTIPFYLLFDGKYYTSSIDLRYFAKKDSSGKTID